MRPRVPACLDDPEELPEPEEPGDHDFDDDSEPEDFCERYIREEMSR